MIGALGGPCGLVRPCALRRDMVLPCVAPCLPTRPVSTTAWALYPRGIRMEAGPAGCRMSAVPSHSVSQNAGAPYLLESTCFFQRRVCTRLHVTNITRNGPHVTCCYKKKCNDSALSALASCPANQAELAGQRLGPEFRIGRWPAVGWGAGSGAGIIIVSTQISCLRCRGRGRWPAEVQSRWLRQHRRWWKWLWRLLGGCGG